MTCQSAGALPSFSVLSTRARHLNELDATLDERRYPVDRDTARAQLDEVVLEDAVGRG